MKEFRTMIQHYWPFKSKSLSHKFDFLEPNILRITECKLSLNWLYVRIVKLQSVAHLTHFLGHYISYNRKMLQFNNKSDYKTFEYDELKNLKKENRLNEFSVNPYPFHVSIVNFEMLIFESVLRWSDLETIFVSVFQDSW